MSLFKAARAAKAVTDLIRSAGRQSTGTNQPANRSSIGRRVIDYVLSRNRSNPYPPRPPGQLVAPPIVAPPIAGPLAPPIVRRASRPQAQPTPPPVAPPTQPPVRPQPSDEFDDIVTLGRGPSYHDDDWRQVMDDMRLTPGSSNVYGYFYFLESRHSGLLLVTFLSDGPGSGPGVTYEYADVPRVKYNEFKNAAAGSAGGAVWDYLRIRGTQSGHQHRYRAVDSATGYVPRKATRRGLAARAIPSKGVGRRSAARNTLPAYNDRRGRPNRGQPDRGRPNRGRPDRGEPDRGAP